MGSLLDAVSWFGSLTDIDASRIAIWGISYGGSLTLAALTSDKVDKGLFINYVINFGGYPDPPSPFFAF